LGLTYFQLDVVTAYLNANLKEEIYMRMPEGFRKYDQFGKEMCIRLLKSLYGLKQAGFNWNKLLESVLLKFGFIQSLVDPCFSFTE